MPQLVDVFRHVFPLLTGDDERPEILGTSVYSAVDRHRFLITAAHVLDRCDGRTIQFPGGVCQTPTSGAIVTSNLPPSGTRSDDETDIGVIRLDPAQSAAMDALGAQAVQIEDRGVHDEFVERDHYVFTGYPSSRNRIIRARRMMDPETCSSIGQALAPAELEAIGLNSAFHIASVYDRENQIRNGVRVAGPEAWGMSGGPVWHLNRATNHCVLIGIGTDWDPIRRLLIGTRIGAAVALMRAAFPETLPFLPSPRRFEVCPESAEVRRNT